jgi:putative transposase
MTYRKRLHVPGGTYYVRRKTEPPHLIFTGPDDFDDFEDFLGLALETTGMKLLGYCLMPDTIHLAITIGRKPVAELMRKVTRYCSQRICERSGTYAKPFPVGFPITLIDPDVYLAPLIHYIHYVPVLAGMTSTLDEYPYTSHFAYIGGKQHLRVYTRPLLTLLDNRKLH